MFLKPPPFRQIFGLFALSALGMLAFGLYLQHVEGLNPCPMCIVQRYALIGVVLLALAGWRVKRMRGFMVIGGLVTLVSGFGAFVAARQSWLQWYPPEIATCGRDFYGMVENFPINRVVPMIFKGSGDCTQVDWTFLGGSIANWSFICFVGYALVGLAIALKAFRVHKI
ncbi:disulfide bond formation protein B [Limnohabitans sp. Rim8]|uniref:disulfide bond formation protein B n=1 Tax=Limnohabitans sp. Rim8 TaxID=1100718 RepID=UPI0033062082